jgi:gluconolactonase
MPLILTLLVAVSAGADFTAGPPQVVVDGFRFTEGPLWIPKTGWIFSDIPADTIYKADKTVFRQPSNQSNGLTLDRQGRLLAAEHQGRRVSCTALDGTVSVLADRFEGKRLNSPNDVIVRSDGTVFFTDPPYGLDGGLEGPNAELKFAGVYAVSIKGEVKCLVRDFNRPNGLALSPDEKTLYIGDSEANFIRAFDVAPDASLSKGRLFASIVKPDGMKVDTQGHLWSSSESGIQVFSPAGERLQLIPLPQGPTNCAFGEADGKTLFVTTPKSVYRISTTIAGLVPGPK